MLKDIIMKIFKHKIEQYNELPRTHHQLSYQNIASLISSVRSHSPIPRLSYFEGHLRYYYIISIINTSVCISKALGLSFLATTVFLFFLKECHATQYQISSQHSNFPGYLINIFISAKSPAIRYTKLN